MKKRIHIVVDETEKERFRLRAREEGKSLSSWLRDAARRVLAEAGGGRQLDTLEELGDFFRSCDEQETDREPAWEEHRRVIERSAKSGTADT
jgi:hypothetical protein